MNRFRLAHVTEFRYDGIVSESYNVVRLRPRDDDTQTCVSFRMHTDPTTRTSSYTDQWGNWVHTFNMLTEHRFLRIEAHSLVHVEAPAALPAGGISLTEFDAMSEALEEHFDFLAPTPYVPHAPELTALMEEGERLSGGTLAGFALSVASLIHDRFRYEKGATHVQSTVMDALRTGAGVCQDFAHVMLAVARMRGIPARYVSGYLVPASASGGRPGAEDVIGGQASHAWIELLVPGAGWFGLDPTVGRPVGPHHVRVAYGRDYGDAAPVRGVYKGHAGQQLFVDVGVRPALDDDGKEYLEETAAAPREAPPVESAPQQEQQQQQ
jgi:transglutaminase-like putative cysteine protease